MPCAVQELQGDDWGLEGLLLYGCKQLPVGDLGSCSNSESESCNPTLQRSGSHSPTLQRSDSLSPTLLDADLASPPILQAAPHSPQLHRTDSMQPSDSLSPTLMHADSMQHASPMRFSSSMRHTGPSQLAASISTACGVKPGKWCLALCRAPPEGQPFSLSAREGISQSARARCVLRFLLKLHVLTFSSRCKARVASLLRKADVL